MVHFVTHFLLNNFLDLLVILFLRIHPIAFHSSLFLHAFIDQWQIWLFFCWVRSIIFHFFFFFLFLHFFFLLLTDSRVVGYGWGRRQGLFIWNWAFILHNFLLFIFLDVFQRLNLLNVLLGELVLHIDILASLLIHFIQHFMHLWIIFQTVCISQSI